jgi:ubiquitin carboxyl-terminal hydrolase 10
VEDNTVSSIGDVGEQLPKSADPHSPPQQRALSTAPESLVTDVHTLSEDVITPQTPSKPIVQPVIPAVPVGVKQSSPEQARTEIEAPKIQQAMMAAPINVQEEGAAALSPPQPKAAPKSWADLVRSKSSLAAHQINGSGNIADSTLAKAKTNNTLAEALRGFKVHSDHKITFLEPRGLVNTGNMCYMNSVSASAMMSSEL